MRRSLSGKSGNIRTIFLFILFQTILYVIFLFLDFTGHNYALSADIKFSVIILCFCYVFFLGRNTDRGIILCMKAALFFTLVSDLFILMLDYYIPGVITFIVVQQLYGLRLLLEKHSSGRRLALRFALQLTVAVTVCLLLWLAEVEIDSLLFISVLYFICILTNTINAVRLALHNRGDRSRVLFAVGMVLFLLCDINVGIFNMSGFIALPENLYHRLYSLSSILMWTFYAPAQVILALSANRK